MDHPKLQDFLFTPHERPDMEYEAWLDVDDLEVQAGLARHLCAIANHGGGFVVSGIANDMKPVGRQPLPRRVPMIRTGCRESSGGIGFQPVTVYWVAASATSTTHPVVWVPSREVVPGAIQSIRTAGASADQRPRS